MTQTVDFKKSIYELVKENPGVSTLCCHPYSYFIIFKAVPLRRYTHRRPGTRLKKGSRGNQKDKTWFSPSLVDRNSLSQKQICFYSFMSPNAVITGCRIMVKPACLNLYN